MSGLAEFHGFLDSTPPYTKLEVTGLFNESDLKERQRRRNVGARDTHASTQLSNQITPKLYCSGDGCKSYQYFAALNTSN
ncbi:hypothetical protein, partial [Vibrio paucivorans]